MEQIGYFLWEVVTLSTMLFTGICLLVLRRRASGNPAFTDRDRQLFFGHPEVRVSKPRFYMNLGIAVFLCYLVGFLEYLLLVRFGASILATAQLITFLGIVKRSFC